MKKDLFPVTWDRNWINEFESPWGIIEKFKYANNVSSQEIFEMFHPVRDKNRNKLNNWLYTLEGIDDELVCSFIGCSLKDKTHNNIENICSIYIRSKQGFIGCFRTYLSFCEICISEGFHSILHQFHLIKKCPYHLIELSDKCPSCKKRIPYLLSDEYLISPFQCACGYSFINITSKREFFSAWRENYKLKINDPVTNEWLLLNENKESKSFIIQLHNSSNVDFLEVLVSILRPDIKLQMFGTCINIYKRSERTSSFSISNNELRESIYQTTRQTLKSVIRHVKNTILSNHKTCIKRYKKMAQDDKVCPFAYSYVHWRKNIEGLKNYWEVENGTHLLKKQSIFHFEFSSKQDSDFLEEVINTFHNCTTDYKIGENELLYILNRTLSILIMHHFHNWLRHSKEYGCSDILNRGLPNDYENLPLFFYEIKADSNLNTNMIQFYYIPKSNQIISSDYLNCPNRKRGNNN